MMKFVIATILVIVSLTNADLPRFRGGFARQTAPVAPADPAAGPNAAPYQPSGWKPAGAAFTLPVRQQQQPQGQYIPQNPPQTSYGPPQKYGPPIIEHTPEEATTTTESVQDVTAETERPARLQNGKLQEQSVPAQGGPQIFLILPQQPQQQSQPIQQPQQMSASFVYTLQQEQPGVASLIAVPVGITGVASGNFARTAKLQAVPLQNQYYPELRFLQFI